MTDVFERAYKAFDPAPLSAADSNLYVDLEPARGEGDVVNRLAKRIRGSAGEPTCQLLAGHHGSGKSTELRRLQGILERGTPPIFVVFCEAKSDLDLNDVDFPEILIALVRQMAAQLKDRLSISLKPGYIKDRLERITNLLGRKVAFDDMDINAGLFDFSAAIKGSPDARFKIREALEPDTSNLLFAANDIISKAKSELTKRGYGDLAIIVDDLDKIVLRDHRSGAGSTAEYLFIHRHAQLAGFQCHVAYSMPLALAYSAQEEKITNLYGGRVPVIPMTKISTPPPRRGPYPKGVECFRQMIARRLEEAQVIPGDVFAGDKIRDQLIKLSGGQPRELMILIREALIGGDLPIHQAAVDRAAREGARAYARQLLEEHVAIVRQVAKTGKLRRTAGNDQLIRELLDSRAVLQYVNKIEWYGVNPLIELPATRRSR